jgi:hypothetical protein
MPKKRQAWENPEERMLNGSCKENNKIWQNVYFSSHVRNGVDEAGPKYEVASTNIKCHVGIRKFIKSVLLMLWSFRKNVDQQVTELQTFQKYLRFFSMRFVHIIVHSRMGVPLDQPCEPNPTTTDWFNFKHDEFGEVSAYLKQSVKK